MDTTSFEVDVDGIGQFRFNRRTMRLEMRIASEYSRLTEGVATPVEFLRIAADAMATLNVLTIEAPDGWDIEAMDPLDDDSYTSILKVHAALREQEEMFRSGAHQGISPSGKSDGGDAGTVVQKDVQTPSD